MKIVVCMKQVPDTTGVRIDPVTNTLIRDGVPAIINPDDKCGIEAALEIKGASPAPPSPSSPWASPPPRSLCARLWLWAATRPFADRPQVGRR